MSCDGQEIIMIDNLNKISNKNLVKEKTIKYVVRNENAITGDTKYLSIFV